MIMLTIQEVFSDWKRAGLAQRVADWARSEWDRRFPGVPIQGERLEEGKRKGGVIMKADRTGGGDFLRVLIRNERGFALRLTFWPNSNEGKWHETWPDVPVHLIGLSEDEARAALEHHGNLDGCILVKDCDKRTVKQLLFKRPGAGWGHDISAVSACLEHEAELDTLIETHSFPS
jgi:hypothetical protein